MSLSKACILIVITTTRDRQSPNAELGFRVPDSETSGDPRLSHDVYGLKPRRNADIVNSILDSIVPTLLVKFDDIITYCGSLLQ